MITITGTSYAGLLCVVFRIEKSGVYEASKIHVLFTNTGLLLNHEL